MELLKRKPASFTESAKLFAELETAKRDIENLLEDVKLRQKSLSDYLTEEMATQGIENIRQCGYTMYPRASRYVSKKSEKQGVTTQMICDVLRELGRGDMVGEAYHPSSLKSLVVEMSEQGDGVPEQLSELLNIGERITLTAVRS